MNKSLRNSSTVRLLRILEEIAKSDDGIGVTELAQRLDLNKSTIYRFLATLEEEQYLEQEPDTKKYHSGIRLFELASRIVNKVDWTKDIRPFLVDLKDRVNETVHLGIIDDHEVVYIDKVECERSIRMYSKVGKRAPVYCTGVGKAILAFLPEEKRNHIMNHIHFHPFTENTITDAAHLKKEIKMIRAQGFALDREEHELGVSCTASPIFNYNGKVLGGISIAGPSSRIDEERLFDLALEVKETAQFISRRLGSL
ncbi:DNA-binding IclR family transcriptional regulator [Bacillus thermophilus]|uniref:DNA-binding IclR family transcriptional regulator n=1 Tax=Siminovitchia thermophila TaxID=1245522 RepID=A0ABS2RC99_9BACI|nr:IclR family transcriptional regulator [Siminovitchia thermophila]MBM7717282.1 DNA-binding IclR family transcriptional regulator [Siminovitchia thermophila]